MLGRFWKYGAGGLAVYLVMVYSYLAYRHMFPVTPVTMTAAVEGLRAPTTQVAASRSSRGTGAFSFRNTRKTFQKKTKTQTKKTSQDKKIIQNEKTPRGKKTIQNEKAQQVKKTIQNRSTTQNKAKIRTASDATGINTPGSAAPTTSAHILSSTMKQTRKLKEMPVLTPVFKGRLGNQLFEYAASFAIAKMKNMSLFIPEGNVINKLFHVDTTVVTFHGCSSWRRVLVECCGYNSNLIAKINKSECQAIGLYLQSWKYFKPVEASIRQQLTFKRNIALVANRKLLSLTQEFLKRQSGWPTGKDGDQGNWTSTHVGIPTTPTGGDTNSSLLHPRNADHPKKTQKKHVLEAGADDVVSNLTYIGIHVRRGDYMSPQSRRQGRITPPAKYYIHAMRYFRAIFPNTLFVVLGDDGSWVNRNIGAPDVVVVQRDSEAVDLCVLSMCNHTILSVGSFGWWAGFLAGGTTVYYKHPYRNNTDMSRWYSNFHSDYVLPDWVPMD
ncbi:galactoside alpha-(1,2)-fucosyltransferase 1-like [Haliotis rubra]|uniref:galactoside alpha-(1,2)-fucosyltransferase 1-like n=1 Tax=Haliotis rubra TaxID=36100 RepID=UPI001EE5B8D7|nr:galactoside alpha-(1,2)-fucosyltransferase 1-like [Haliotis rubra]